MAADTTPKAAPSLATGAKLTPDTWADFVARLRHHHRGEGVRDHHTADALFIVQARRFTYGIDLDYDPERVIVCEDSVWTSPQAYWDDADEGLRADLNATAQRRHTSTFLGASQNERWDMLNDRPDHRIVGRAERWEYVGAHLTREAADAFIRRKAHDYRDGLRVYVESRQYAWEFCAVLDAIIDGKLALVP